MRGAPVAPRFHECRDAVLRLARSEYACTPVSWADFKRLLADKCVSELVLNDPQGLIDYGRLVVDGEVENTPCIKEDPWPCLS